MKNSTKVGKIKVGLNFSIGGIKIYFYTKNKAIMQSKAATHVTKLYKIYSKTEWHLISLQADLKSIFDTIGSNR